MITRTNSANAVVDVLVIGAGVGGASAAISAARALGASSNDRPRVMLVERAAWPRDKVCGCCLSAEGVNALERLGVDVGGLGARGATLRQAEMRDARARAWLVEVEPGLVVDRATLDAALVRRAVALGVSFVDRCTARVESRIEHGVERLASSGAKALGSAGIARDAERGGWRVSLSRSVETSGEPRAESIVYARRVIVADGLAGRALDGVASRVARGSLMGVGARAEAGSALAESLPAGRVVLCVGRGGYVGVVRLGDGSADVAAAVDPARAREAGGPVALMSRWLRDAGLEALAPATRVHGTAMLTRRRVSLGGRGLIVVGDAAGYVEPFTGEGMTWALLGGEAGGAMAATLDDDAALTGAWERWHRSNVGRRQLACRVVRTALRVPGLVGATLWCARRVPGFGAAIARAGAALGACVSVRAGARPDGLVVARGGPGYVASAAGVAGVADGVGHGRPA